jgi:FixJ family two-component response regulator
MTKSENTPLNKNELEIVKLTVQGESQRSIAKQLDLSPSAVCRTLQRPHVIDKIPIFNTRASLPDLSKNDG